MNGLDRLSQLMQSTNIDDTIKKMAENVKQHPQDLHFRNALINLNCINGDYEKALQQITTMALMEKGDNQQSELFKNLILSEFLRVEILAGHKAPTLFGKEEPEWIKLQNQANQSLSDNHIAQADALREHAFSAIPETSGDSPRIGSFDWIADSDSRIGPVFEFIFAGGYRWLPFENIEHITINAPTNLLHLVWMSGSVSIEGKVYNGYIPARYPIKIGDEAIHKLSKQTDWQEVSAYNVLAQGRKMYITDKGEFPITEIDSILIND